MKVLPQRVYLLLPRALGVLSQLHFRHDRSAGASAWLYSVRTGFAGGYLTLWKGCHEDTVLLPNAKVNSLYPFRSFMRIPQHRVNRRDVKHGAGDSL